MNTTEKRVEITAADIAAGERHSASRNPVALAFSRTFGVPALVFNDRDNGWLAEYRPTGNDLDTAADLPEVAQRFLDWWEYGPRQDPEKYAQHVQPFVLVG